MRIRVVTSINVRSSPFASPLFGDGVLGREPGTEPGRDDIIPENPSLKMPTAPGQHPRKSHGRRTPKHPQFPAWFSGFSSVQHAAPAGTHRTRSQASTRGLIDPNHSPTSGIRETGHRRGPTHTAYAERLFTGMGYPSHEDRHGKHRRKRPTKMDSKKKRTCLPQTTDPKIRQKIIGCLFFGTLLTIVLTTCTPIAPLPSHIYKPRRTDNPADLALATSESARGANFHGIFIFFILVLTILFCHYLIRLCMLAFCPTKRFARPKRAPRLADEEAGFAGPSRAVPVVLDRDDELSLSAHNAVAEEDKPLPPPPPAYGLWRGSTVCLV